MFGSTIDPAVLIPRFDRILLSGLCEGPGTCGGRMCIESAICEALDLPGHDAAGYVEDTIRSFSMTLNACRWSSPAARAAGMRDLGLAQIGSLGVVDGREFSALLAERTTRFLIPVLLRELYPADDSMRAVAERCACDGSYAGASWAATHAGHAAQAARATFKLHAARATSIAEAACSPAAGIVSHAARTDNAPVWQAAWNAGAESAACEVKAMWAAEAARAAEATRTAWLPAEESATWSARAAWAAEAARTEREADSAYAGVVATLQADKYLRLSATLAVAVLIELGSPGAEWIAADVRQQLERQEVCDTPMPSASLPIAALQNVTADVTFASTPVRKAAMRHGRDQQRLR